MKSNPRLSIVMPVFNHPKELKVMIDSIMVNGFDDYELILVDDGSDSPTLSLLEEYSDKDSRITFVKRARLPKGAPTCRNIGFEMAIGEYIMFFDSDDYVTPSCLATRVRCIEEQPNLDFMVFPSGIYDESGFNAAPNLYAYGYPIYKDDLEHFARRLLPFVVWNNIYRTKSLKTHQILWDENLMSMQDADFNVSTILAGMAYGYASTQPDYGYRISTTSSVSKGIKTELHYRSNAYAVKMMYKKIREVHGSKYDKALLYGLCRVYNGVVTGNGVSAQLTNLFATEIENMVPNHAKKLRRTTRISVALKAIIPMLPSKMARQLPMLFFLLEHRRRQKSKLRQINHLQKA